MANCAAAIACGSQDAQPEILLRHAWRQADCVLINAACPTSLRQAKFPAMEHGSC
jgi:hypothetical protein